MSDLPKLSEREHRQLALLHIREEEGYRCATAPEHDGDVLAGMWYALGIFWKPSTWELEWDRTRMQSWAHTFRRLREKDLVD